jgi:hypothetical protein
MGKPEGLPENVNTQMETIGIVHNGRMRWETLCAKFSYLLEFEVA